MDFLFVQTRGEYIDPPRTNQEPVARLNADVIAVDENR
jgi:hypothetical protein